MLRHPGLESFAEINRRSPGMFHSNAVKRPSVKSLRNIPSKKKRGFAEQHEAAELAAAEGTYLKLSGNHVAGKGVTRGIHPAEFAGV